jgi:hypothetical protein
MQNKSSIYRRVVLAAVLGTIAVSGSACIGKGKAPPPVDAPIIRKG